MALENHIEFLNQKRAHLTEMVREAELHPATDDTEIRRLKAQRLSIKDEVVRLREEQRDAA